MRQIATVATACVAVTVLAGCGGSGGGGGGGDAQVASGGTFTMATNADPGNLDPQASAATNLYQLSHFAYDSLVNLDAKGTIVSGLATDWRAEGQQLTLTLKQGITCSDGSPFTAADAAANIGYVADPAHQSPFLGVFVPAGATATADGDTLTVQLAGPAPFALNGLAGVPMVCGKAVPDRSVLAGSTLGTGPYQLKEVVPGDHLTYTKRKGYTWGPDGAGTDTKGVPDTITVKVVPNETTAANLLLSGGLNAAQIVGQDAQRLAKQKLFSASLTTLLGEMWFNQAPGRPAADPAVRKALTQALDLGQVAKVLSSGQGGPATQLAANAPAACPGSSVTGAVPEKDVAAAKKALDDAGWKAGSGGVRSKGGVPLKVTFLYNTALGSGASAAAELAAAAWKDLGVDVATTPQDNTAAVNTLFSTGDWDVAWASVNVSSPDQLVPFLSGPAVPEGNNFAHIDNAGYTSAVAKAMTTEGAQGCDQWFAAEKDLFKAADVVPFANQELAYYGKGAEFSLADVLQPTSIRMLAG